MNYIIDRNLNIKNDAGFKARKDILDICEAKKIKIIKAYSIYNNKLFRIMSKIKGLILLNKIKSNSNVIIQYPIDYFYLEKAIFTLEKKKCNKILMIHDIESLRNNEKIKEKEINIFNKFDSIICHNNNMKLWLLNNNVISNIYEIEIFDYICNKEKKKMNLKDNYTISYATGMLGSEKSRFLFDLNSLNLDTNILLYGSISDKLKCNLNNNMIYKKSLSPKEIVEKIEGDFGLIWDGTSINICDGSFGEYTKFNTPHKLSMYIASEIPVIVWKEAACSKFVKENNIGIVIDKLSDIDNLLKNIPYEKYLQMKSNCIKIGDKVRKGYFFSSIIDKLFENNLKY
ncbi:hypothetical protein [Clostridium perfringens]|uniref:hypothetical protein n=1 Tax=Clostridium perfringens TaxID=1502 RepID=UPI0024BD3971|nr:hypothetical protein [Clostridium perfringens]